MVSFAQLRDAKFDEIDSAWRSWRKLVENLEHAEDTYQSKFLQGVRSAQWVGEDAKAAMRALLPVRTRIRVATGEASAIASVLNTAQGKFQVAQKELRSAINSAEAQYLKVGNDGSIDFPDSLPARYSNWQELQTVATGIQSDFIAAVKKATVADNEIAGALRALSPDVLNSKKPLVGLQKDTGVATELAGFDSENVPPKMLQNPSAISDWWKSLPEEQRHLLMNAYPEKIGWLNGIPSEDRDEANRTHLAARINDLQEDSSRSPYEQRSLDRLQKLNTNLQNYAQGGKDVYLLGVREGPEDDPRTPIPKLDDADSLKPGADGQAVVAFGNPDTAKHTAVYVPGTGVMLDSYGGQLDRTAHLWDLSNEYAPGQVSTIAWLGYDAPDRISLDATRDQYAESGGQQLDSFINGVDAAQRAAGQSDTHITAVGHSYGSTVIGEGAKHGNGLAVDDVVVAGSPGMHVSSASELNVGERHVWTAGSPSDPVPPSGAWFHGGKTMDWRDGHPVIGPVTPTNPDFGGNAMTVDTDGHSNYWTENSMSLQNQARVVVGQYENVRLIRGEPPQ